MRNTKMRSMQCWPKCGNQQSKWTKCEHLIEHSEHFEHWPNISNMSFRACASWPHPQTDPTLEHFDHAEHRTDPTLALEVIFEHSEHLSNIPNICRMRLIEHSEHLIEHFEHWSNIPNISLYVIYRTPNRPNTTSSSRDHFWTFQTCEHQTDPTLEHFEHWSNILNIYIT